MRLHACARQAFRLLPRFPQRQEPLSLLGIIFELLQERMIPARTTLGEVTIKDEVKPSGARLEDRRFLTGKGRYVADISLAHQTHMALVLSTHAHAKLGAIDTSEAE